MLRIVDASFGLVLVGFIAASGWGCGSPKPGEKCDTSGFFCADSRSALECRNGSWVNLPCKGAGGCARETDVIRCDMSGNVIGDPCATSAEAKGLCAPDGLSVLECRDGKIEKTSSCASCEVVGEQISCTPP